MPLDSDKLNSLLGNSDGQAGKPPVLRREMYLSRVGSAATLMVIEWVPDADGGLRKRLRFALWPGL